MAADYIAAKVGSKGLGVADLGGDLCGVPIVVSMKELRARNGLGVAVLTQGVVDEKTAHDGGLGGNSTSLLLSWSEDGI
jgi:hypothetical protein